MTFSMRFTTAISLCFILFTVVCRGTPVPDVENSELCSCPCKCSEGGNTPDTPTAPDTDHGSSTSTTVTACSENWTEETITSLKIKTFTETQVFIENVVYRSFGTKSTRNTQIASSANVIDVFGCGNQLTNGRTVQQMVPAEKDTFAVKLWFLSAELIQYLQLNATMYKNYAAFDFTVVNVETGSTSDKCVTPIPLETDIKAAFNISMGFTVMNEYFAIAVLLSEGNVIAHQILLTKDGVSKMESEKIMDQIKTCLSELNLKIEEFELSVNEICVDTKELGTCGHSGEGKGRVDTVILEETFVTTVISSAVYSTSTSSSSSSSTNMESTSEANNANANTNDPETPSP